MASLTITIGAVSGSVTASNAKAQNILNDVVALYGLTGTDQEKLNQVAQLCADFLVGKSRQYREEPAIETAKTNVANDVSYQWVA